MNTRFCIQATWDDVPHLTKKQKDEMWAAIPIHERKARAKGVPMLGSGAIFPVDEERITCQPIAIPRHWKQIIGIDFGTDHPFAAARIAYDSDADCIYVTHCYRQRGEHTEGGEWTGSPAFHAVTLRSWGKWIPIAWPHDGLAQDRQSGERLAEIYRSHELNMLPERATHEDGGNGVEAGLTDILERMQSDRFKVFAGLNDWFSEFRMYHRKDGKIVKLNDDLMSAMRYAVMMRRFAATEPGRASERRRPNLGTRA